MTTTGHRPVSPAEGEPARMSRGQPAVEEVSLNKQSAWRSTHGKTAAPTVTPHPSNTSHKNPHTKATIVYCMCLPIFSPMLSCREWSAAIRGSCIRMRYCILMSIINESSEEKPKRIYSVLMIAWEQLSYCKCLVKTMSLACGKEIKHLEKTHRH